MGRDEEANRLDNLIRQSQAERMLGDSRPFGVFDESGCPKCGSKTFTKVMCGGHSFIDRDGKSCPVEGDHLHAWCGLMPQPGVLAAVVGSCGWSWVEHTKDWVSPDAGRVVFVANEELGTVRPRPWWKRWLPTQG
jgi:RNA polymerase subunit RPABC4/transcription elongation factor Spt4